MTKEGRLRGFQRIDFDDHEGFIEALTKASTLGQHPSPLAPEDATDLGNYSAGPGSSWRGVATTSWKLEPSVFRHGPLKSLLFGQTSAATETAQVQLEAELLLRFLVSWRRLAPSQPSLSAESYHSLRSFLKRVAKGPTADILNAWPFVPADQEGPNKSQVRQLLGVAQHYGCPTRLLDFTEDALTAAAFAARDAALMATGVQDPRGADRRLCVWHFNKMKLMVNKELAEFDQKCLNVGLPILDHVGELSAPNRRVLAQRGHFVMTTGRGSHGPKMHNLEHWMDQVGKRLSSPFTPHLTAFTLDWSEAQKLHWKLLRQGKASVQLYPDMYGAGTGAVTDLVANRQLRGTKGLFD